jgi:hypothetical protein
MQNINYQFFGVRLLFIAIGQWPRYPLQAPPQKIQGGGFPLLSGVVLQQCKANKAAQV